VHHQNYQWGKDAQPSAVCETRTTEGVTTARGATSALKDQSQKHLEAMCMMHVFQSIFERRATSSSMTAKPTIAFA
jgi:hypothetical protein